MPRLTCLLLALALFGCSDDDSHAVELAPGDPFGAYEDMNVSVIGADAPDEAVGSPETSDAGAAPDAPGGAPILVGTPDGDVSEAEVCISDTLCEVPPVDSSNWCERDGGPVDLIYVDGELVDTICYPPADDPDRPVEVIETTDPGDIEVAQMANRTTVVIDPATDGMPIEGDLTVEGNNVAIYGNGPDNTILDGDVVLDGNAVRLRGVTITGDLVISKNRAAIVLCRVLGNLRLETESTNGSVVAETEVFGDFTSDSNNNIFVGNSVLGLWDHTGNNNTCDRNVAFTDDDDDGQVDEDERGEPLDCTPGRPGG
ncbi:MAG: hypothetical protein PVI30_18675 [Myxococcales bacterium]|jgi:hypothetical protein